MRSERLVRGCAIHFRSALLTSMLVTSTAAAEPALVLRPDRVFDGKELHEGWVVVVEGDRITAASTNVDIPADARVLDLPGTTLLPGLIEGHSHLLLHPYDETSWNDQVLYEPQALRVARATAAASMTLRAGFTTERDLGTEGAGYADVGLRDAIAQGIIPGPRLLVVTRAIVTTGSYGPKGAPEWQLPLGAEPANGVDDLSRVVRDQIGRGADWVKVYADSWSPNGEARPTFTQAELDLIVELASNSGRPVSAHANSEEGMRRATLAGARTIEHGDGGTREVFRLMAERGVALCPTLTATESMARYGGWNPQTEPEPPLVVRKRAMFREALAAKVPICFGSDVGVFSHGDNAREFELMVDYGMSARDALIAATSGNAEILRLSDRGSIRPGLLADLVAIEGNPMSDIGALRNVRLVVQGGRIVRDEEKSD